MNRDELIKWADSRNTDLEIADAIIELSLLPERNPDEIWEDPTDVEFEEVCRAAFLKTDEDELFWGEITVRRPE